MTARAASAGEEAVGADLGEFVLDGSLVDAVGDAGLEFAEGLDGEERVRLLPDLDDVNECHLVIETERSVAHAVGLGAVQLGVHRLDELCVGVGLIGLGPVADEALVHGYLLRFCPLLVQTPAGLEAER